GATDPESRRPSSTAYWTDFIAEQRPPLLLPLFQTMSLRPPDARGDLHLHSTCSDGQYTPRQVGDLARQSGLAALALTYQDSVSRLGQACAEADPDLEVVPGVEITALWRGRGLRLLGYFFRADDPALAACLEGVCAQRRQRFQQMADRLRDLGVPLAQEQ